MNIQDAQKIFRQQITLASKQLTWCLNSSTRIEHLSALQGSVFCLHLGLSVYVSALFNLDRSQVLLCVDTANLGAVENYRQEEIVGLLENSDSWLMRLNSLAASMGGLTDTSKITESYKSENLIASSALIRPSKPSDWRTEKDNINNYIESAKELLERHISSDVEY